MPIRQLTNYPDTEGGEFAQHEKVSEATGVQIFFARPYASYQRGTNENTNGLIRRCWPKKMRMGALSKQEISDMELRLDIVGPLNFDYERYSTEALLPKVSSGIGTLSLLIFQLFCSMTPRKVLLGLTPIEAYTGAILHLLC